MKYSWYNLHDAYTDPAISSHLEALEEKFHGTDETDFFAPLVNTSVSKKEPFHRWIRYREGYAGELVKEILRRFPIQNDQAVLDPMCGSGSTMVACNEIGVHSVGLDVNPFAVLSTEAKGLKFTKEELIKLKDTAYQVVEKAKTSAPKYSQYDDDVKKYFDSVRIDELVALKNTIGLNRTIKRNKVLFFALLAVVESCSNRKKDGNGLATKPTKVQCCFKEFINQIEIMIEDYSKPSSSSLSQAKLLSANKMLSLDTRKKIGSIIFSPPYANSFDYFESYKMELIFGEWTTAKGLREARKSLVRNYRMSFKEDLSSDLPIVEDICRELWSKIPIKEKFTGKKDSRTRLVPNMLRAYFEDMKEVIAQGYNMLAPNGHMHIVVDQSAYVGVAIPTDIIFAQIAESIGYEVVQITKCRKANTSAQQLKQYPYLKEILRESIVTIKK